VFVLTCAVFVVTCFVMCGGVCICRFCNVWVWVCVGFVMYGHVYVWVLGFVMCGCFGNMCTCIYRVLYCLYCVSFLLFRLCIFILICFVCTSVRTTATE